MVVGGAPLDVTALFVTWLEEWKAEAAGRGLKTQHMYGRAAKSLRAYEGDKGHIVCGADAEKVKYIGPTVASRLQKRLEKHCADNGVAVPQPPKPPSPPPASAAPAAGNGKKRKKQAYVPRRRSAAHALLIAQWRASEKAGFRGHMTKAEVVSAAQPLCDASLTIVKAGTHYDGWAAMGALIRKGLVEKAGNPPRFSLTIEGEVLAKKLDDVEKAHSGGGGGGAAAAAAKRAKTIPQWATTGALRPPAAAAAAGAGAGGPALSSSPPGASSFAGAGAADGGGYGSALFSPVDGGGGLKASDFDMPAVPPELSHLRQGGAAAAGAASPGVFSREASAAWRKDVHNSPSWVLMPGQFDLALAIDTSEHTGSRRDKGVIQQQLESMGVATDVRRLTLGDFLWVAKEKVQPVPGQLPLPHRRELVLDYVIERKRMDDLSSSICDKRFEEQKHRFAAADIKHPVYLVEDYGRIDNHTLTADQLRQAMANSEVGDGFFVKHTADTVATVAYLVLMHRHVCARHSDRPLVSRGVGQDALLRAHPSAHLCSTFDDFTTLTTKSPAIRVDEMFVKQLVQMAGVTVERAAAIVKAYPTPRKLMAAYDALGSDKERDGLLENIEFKDGPRNKIGSAVSAKIARLYCEETLP